MSLSLYFLEYVYIHIYMYIYVCVCMHMSSLNNFKFLFSFPTILALEKYARSILCCLVLQQSSLPF